MALLRGQECGQKRTAPMIVPHLPWTRLALQPAVRKGHLGQYRQHSLHTRKRDKGGTNQAGVGVLLTRIRARAFIY